jgi:hypothetical protein
LLVTLFSPSLETVKPGAQYDPSMSQYSWNQAKMLPHDGESLFKALSVSFFG